MKKILFVLVSIMLSTSFAKQQRTIAQAKDSMSSAFALNILLSNGSAKYTEENGSKTTVASLISSIVATEKNESSKIDNNCKAKPKIKGYYVSECTLNILLKWSDVESSLTIDYKVHSLNKDKVDEDSNVMILNVMRAG